MYKKNDKILIIGGNDAGLSAAGRALRRDPAADVLVLEKSKHVGYASCGFPLLISGNLNPKQFSGPGPETISEKRGFKVFLEHNVIDINLPRRYVTAQKNNGDLIEIPFNKLILASGAVPVVSNALSPEMKNVFSIRNYDDIAGLNGFLLQNGIKNATVVGAGYIGIEFAEALSHRGLKVAVVDKSNTILPEFDTDIVIPIQERMKQAGIRLFLSSTVNGTVQKNGHITSVNLTGANETVQTDLLLAATGVKPNVELARKAGIPVGKTGAVQVNNRMQTGRINVFAAGDCVETFHIILKKPQWLPFAGIATRQGRIAGTNAVGGSVTYPGAVGTSMIRAFGLEFGKTGLNMKQASGAGFEPVKTVINQLAKPVYVNNNASVTVLLVHDSRTKKILGAQIVGEIEAGQRLNILATAIFAGLTIKDMAYLDLGYTPAITNMWDPVAVASSVALTQKGKEK
ncbi:FAD-dependent oxidoreductase [candidate division KSB1 bacterium]|nr:FAD-dependent oxidoreductase [candidate division KSB1 bacterium]